MTLEFTIPKLACSACVETVTTTVRDLDANAEVQADPTTKQVLIVSTTPETDLRQALTAAGYPPT
ncbi:MAG: heavy-metal-associated domain-containing protein [Synechococcaceae cyanobacterium SM2_3_1]|nr:heavy-metal-associated domain-containing protein [Synechococcaceae cyanobacterium SM2_3_1]